MSASFGVGDLVDGKYRILRLIGEGGWGIVFEGENARTLKRVAIKVLRTQSAITPDIQARFEREAQAAGRIGSEHIVEVFDLGTLADGTSYMVMELLAGEDLSTRVHAAGRLAPVAAVKLVVQLLDGLGAAHAAGILHRDLKPENLFLVPTRTGEDFVKILDFGISKFANAPAISATMTGAVLGSPFYMAPEQARGLKQIDARTDLYAVGTVLFECITGRVPFEGDNFNDLMFKIVLAPRPNPIELVPDLDSELAPTMLKAISADPADRFQTAEQFRDALVQWLDTQGVASVRAPELRRAFNMTPTTRSNPDIVLNGRPGITPPKREKPSWSDATVAMPESIVGKDTPVASSSTLEPSRRGRRKVFLVALGAALVLAVAGGLSMQRTHAHEVLAPESATPHAAPPVAEPGPFPSPSPGEALAAAVSPGGAPAGPGDAAVIEIDDPSFAHGSALAGHGGTKSLHTPHLARDAGTALPVQVVDAPKPSAAPVAPAAPPAKPGDSVEGRGIRTNL
jgi:serine/threonine protein kinase